MNYRAAPTPGDLSATALCVKCLVQAGNVQVGFCHTFSGCELFDGSRVVCLLQSGK